MSTSIQRAQAEMRDPTLLPITVGQIWVALDTEDNVMRRLRIIAPYDYNTDEKMWVYEEMPGGVLRTQIGRFSRLPEFNLRMVFRPE